jgi:uncharacterized membrane protein YheB (UPF0754 family)
MNPLLLSVPVIGAFTGWLLHRALIATFLRRLTTEQPALARKAGQMAAAQAGDLSVLTDKIKDPAMLESVRPYIAQHVDQFLQHKLQEKIPVISMFVGQGTLDKIKEGLMEEIDLLLPEVIGKYAGSMVSSVDIAKIVADRITAMPGAQLQATVRQALDKPLRMLALAGALTGFITGLLALIIAVVLG